MSPDDVASELRANFHDKEYALAYAEDFLNAAIATQIKVLREDRGLTQSDLAELAGMKQSRISVMEDVNYGSWNLKTLIRLAAAFDVALSVSFEPFSKLIANAATFSRSTLSCRSRLEDLAAATLPVPPIAATAPAAPSSQVESVLDAINAPTASSIRALQHISVGASAMDAQRRPPRVPTGILGELGGARGWRSTAPSALGALQ